MRSGDIIFVRGHSLIPNIIRHFDGEFSHCAIAVSSTHILEAQGGTKSRITRFYFDDYEILDLGFTDSERDMIVHMGIQLVGYKYDYLQVIGFFLEKVLKFNFNDFLNSHTRFICSELIDMLLFGLGKLPEDEYVGDKTPNELYEYIIKNFVDTVID